jgi:ABC-2 type transport system permease protein
MTQSILTTAANTQTRANFTSPAPAQGSLVLATASLWRREMVRFFRQRSRVVGAFAQPLLFWLVIGSGVGRSMAIGAASTTDTTAAASASADHMSYLVFFYPGTIVMMLLFTAIFSTISVIEDRREGFLQGVLVAPIPRLAIVLGKVFGGASVGMLQGLILLAAWPLIGGWPGLLPMLEGAVVMALLAIALTSLGLCVAWPMRSTAGFHGIMMLFLLPMWMLSGSLFPVTGAVGWIKTLMFCNPLMYGYAAFSAIITGSSQGVGAPVSVLPALLVTVAFTLFMLLTAVAIVRRPSEGGV